MRTLANSENGGANRMHPRPSMKTGTFFLFIFVLALSNGFAQSWTLPRDAQGWSALQTSTDSRIIYVSSTDGDDGSAEFYSPAQIGNNPRQPATTIKPYASIGAAIAQIRDGYPDWVLLKAGDTWTYEMLQLHDIGQGRGPNERIVFTYYGSGTQRPVIQTDGNGIRSWGKNYADLHEGIHFWAFVGIEFYNHKADPDSPDYSSSVTHTQGTSLSAGGSYLLFEDCKFNFLEIIVQGVDRNWEQVEIRRNIVVDTYYINSCNDRPKRPSGIFAKYIVNLLLEENTFDHNGWSERFPNSGRNAYNHNLYMSWEIYQDVISRGNINSRASGNAAQWRGGAVVEKNLYIQGPAGLFVGHENGNAASVAVRDNVVLEGLSMGDCSQATSATWGITLDQEDFALFNDGVPLERNIVAHHLDYPARTALDQGGDEVLPLDNIVYKWNESEDMWDENWADPERSVGSYHQSIGGAATTEAFLDSARNRGLRQWPEEYSAYAVINYIREGFNMTPVSATSGLVSVTGISLNVDSLEIAGESVKVNATIEPQNATYQSVTWSSSDESIATVDFLGSITGLSAGTATIWVESNEGGFQDSLIVTVVNYPVTSVSVAPQQLNLFEGQVQELNATVLPEDAFDLSVSWTSLDPSIASVNAAGQVEGVAVGETMIIASSNSSSHKDTTVVQVYSIIPAEGWVETFEDLANGATSDGGESAWSLTTNGLSSAAIFEVQDGALYGQELGVEAVLTTETIYFADSVTLVVDWEASGALEDTDYLKAYYKLDGGAEVLFGEAYNGTPRSIVSKVVKGSSVQIVVRVLNTGANEYAYIHNIVAGGVEIPVSAQLSERHEMDKMVTGKKSPLQIVWNGASKRLSVQSGSNSTENSHFAIKIFNLRGELQYSQPLISADGSTQGILDLSALRSGVYIARVTSSQGQALQKFMITE